MLSAYLLSCVLSLTCMTKGDGVSTSTCSNDLDDDIEREEENKGTNREREEKAGIKKRYD